MNPFLADGKKGTGFDEADLGLLWEALVNAFQFDQSAARPAGSMAARRLIVFKHDQALGSAPSHTLLERVTVTRKDESKPPRAFSDYEVSVNRDDMPPGVEILEPI